MKTICLIFFLVFFTLKIFSQSFQLSATYSSEIPTALKGSGQFCNPNTLSLKLPAGNSWVVGAITTEYTMTGKGGGKIADQRSIIKFANTGNSETAETAGPNITTGGSNTYSRVLNIGQGEYEAGSFLNFQMAAYRTMLGSACNSTYNSVDANSWKITINYSISTCAGVPPILNIPADITIETSTLPPVDPSQVSAISCGIVVPVEYLGEQADPPSCSQKITRTWRTTNTFGDITITKSQVITRTDKTPPVITFQTPSYYITSNSQSYPSIANVVVNATDDNAFTLAFDHETIHNGSCMNNYDISRFWKAIDGCGNSSLQYQLIVSIDNENPKLILPEPLFINSCATDIGINGGVFTSDNFGYASLTMNEYINYPSACTKTFYRVYTATDNCGNSTIKNVTDTIHEGIKPTIACPANLIITPSIGQCMEHSFIFVSATDCSPLSQTQSGMGFSGATTGAFNGLSGGFDFNAGVTNIFANAQDICGNYNSCVFKVIVQPKPINIPAGNATNTMPVDIEYYFPNTNCNELITRIQPIGSVPISGNTTAKVWQNGNGYPADIVSRHYEISPETNPNTAQYMLTLYFENDEFIEYNNSLNQADLLLPNSTAGNNTEISNIRILKYDGLSNNGTGLPNSYTGTPTIINPADQNIIYANNRWEISFKTAGKGGYFLTTADKVLCNQTNQIYSITDGGWNIPETWSCNRIPLATDEVTIKALQIVTVPINYQGVAKKTIVENDGKLEIKEGANIKIN